MAEAGHIDIPWQGPRSPVSGHMKNPTNPSQNRLEFVEIWELLTRAEKEDACLKFWAWPESTPARTAATQVLGTIPGFRKGFIAKAPLKAKMAILSAKLGTPTCQQLIPTVLAIALLEATARPNLQALEKGVTDAANDAGIKQDVSEVPTSVLATAIDVFLHQYPGRSAFLVLAIAVAAKTPVWRLLPDALDQLDIKLRDSLGAKTEDNCNSKEDNMSEQLISLKRQLQEAKATAAARERDLNKALEAARAKVEALTKQIADLIAERETAVRKQVEEELSQALRPWIANARFLAKLSQTRTDLSLAKRVKTVLAKQEAFDMKYGSRTRLKNRLSEFTSYAETIRSVLEDSLAPHPEMEPLLREIEREIRQLRLQLNIEVQASPLLGKIIDAINRAQSEEKLAEIELSIDSLRDKEVFSTREVTALYRRLHIAYDRLDFRNQHVPNKPTLRRGWELSNVLASNRPAIVYLDAHNVLLQMADCYGSLFEGGRITPKAEEALIQDVIKLAEGRDAVSFRVVIDAHEASENQRVPNVVVERSSGHGRERADSAIVLHVTKSEHPENCFVVTQDGTLRAQVNALGGVFAPVPVWQLMLEGFGVRQRLETLGAESVEAGTPKGDGN